jgi:hypothetical protein
MSIDKKININHRNQFFGGALYAAAAIDNAEMVSFLLSQGADVDQTGGRWGTALCASLGDRESSKAFPVLLKAGANPNLGEGYLTALIIAGEAGRANAVAALLSQPGLDVAPESDDSETIAHHLCRHGDVANLRRLIAEYPHTVRLWQVSYDMDMTPLGEVLCRDDGKVTAADDEIVEILLSHLQTPADAGWYLPRAQRTKAAAESRGQPVPVAVQRLLKWGEEEGLDVEDYRERPASYYEGNQGRWCML